MLTYKGSCYCKAVQYNIKLASTDGARTSLCHCRNCKKWTGSAFGVTTKVPKEAFHITRGSPKESVSDNTESGLRLHRHFCAECGGNLLEYAGDGNPFRYVCYGSLDDESAKHDLRPKGEFFCSARESWMPEVSGVFHKQRIQE